MSNAYNGRVLGADNIPSFKKASGIWRPTFIAGQLRGLADGLRFPPSLQDPSFSSVVLLLHFDDIGDANHNGGSITNYGTCSKAVDYVQPVNGGPALQDVRPSVLHFGAAVANIGIGAASASIRSVQVLPDTSTLSMGTGDFTIEGWYWFQSSFSQSSIFDFRTGASSVCPEVILFSTGSLTYQVSATQQITTATGVIAAGSWFHIAVARSGTSTKMFVNGTALGGTYTDSNNYTSGGVTIGNNNLQGGIGNAGMTGYVGEFRVTKGVCRYTTTFTPPTARFPDY